MLAPPSAKAIDDPPAALVVLVTCPDAQVAEAIAGRLVTEGLAACVNQIPGITSTYQWEGRLHRDSEILLMAKTTAERLRALEARVTALHPYELPEIIAIPVCGGSERYLAWLGHRTALRQLGDDPA